MRAAMPDATRMTMSADWFIEYRAGPALPQPRAPLHDGLELGRAVEQGLLLADPTVSRVHARVLRQQDRWLVVDLGSLGGTFVNEHRLTAHVPFPLLPRDRLRIGPWQFDVRDRARADGARTADAARDGEAARMTRISHRRDARLDWLLSLLTEIDTHSDRWAGRWLQRLAGLEGFPFAMLLARDAPDADPFGAWPADAKLAVIARDAVMNLSADELSVVADAHHQYLVAPVGNDAALIVATALDAEVSRVALLIDDAARVAALLLAQGQRGAMSARLTALGHELEQARAVQRRILPRPEGQVSQVSYAFDWRPGQAVGGDWVDVFALDAQRTVIALGDVAGSGFSAALLMGALQAFLRAAVVAYGDLVLAMRAANTWLLAHAGRGRFATLWIGVFDARTRSVTAVDAGHGFTFHHLNGDGFSRLQLRGTVPLGVDPGASFVPEIITLHGDARLVLLSDGVAETLEPRGAEFLDDALARALAGSDSAARDRTQLVTALLAGGEEPSDDATLLSVGWSYPEAK
jgi:serine phosphatase RsbU (regulator of sigma subunit)